MNTVYLMPYSELANLITSQCDAVFLFLSFCP